MYTTSWRIVFIIPLCLQAFVRQTFSSLEQFVSFQRRAITPFHGNGNSGSGNNLGQTPIPNQNNHQSSSNPINTRVIKLRQPVDRPPELPKDHPIRPYGGNSNDKGKRKMEDSNDSQQSKSQKNDHQAGTSKHHSPPSKKSIFEKYYDYENKVKAEVSKRTVQAGALTGTAALAIEGYQRTKRKFKQICENCNRAFDEVRKKFTKEKIKVRNQMLQETNPEGLIHYQRAQEARRREDRMIDEVTNRRSPTPVREYANPSPPPSPQHSSSSSSSNSALSSENSTGRYHRVARNLSNGNRSNSQRSDVSPASSVSNTPRSHHSPHRQNSSASSGRRH